MRMSVQPLRKNATFHISLANCLSSLDAPGEQLDNFTQTIPNALHIRGWHPTLHRDYDIHSKQSAGRVVAEEVETLRLHAAGVNRTVKSALAILELRSSSLRPPL